MTARQPGTLSTATVLFTDVVGSTVMRTSLGEELADDYFRRHEQLLRAVAAAHGSIFVKGLGDGLMALFASATAALDASVAIEQEIDNENEHAMTPVTIRAALSAGDVCWMDHDVSGLPIVEAARLVGVASGGQVLCTDLVRRLAQGRGRHEFKDLGPVTAKGLAEPLQVCELLWRHSDQDPDAQVPPWLKHKHLLPFVGRHRELELMDDALRDARSGRRMVFLEGGAGAGKTRLASLVTRRAVEQGFIVLAGRCTDPPNQAYQPIAAAVEWITQTSPAVLIRAGVDEQCGPLARLAPSLTAPPLALSLPPVTDPLADRYQMLASLRTLVRRLTDIKPVLVVIDDLHWATPESIEMIRSLAHDSEGLALLILTTARPVTDDLDPMAVRSLRKLTAESRPLTLGALSQQDIAQALTAVAWPSETEQAAARLHAMTGGNALFVTEMIRDLSDRGNQEAWRVPKSVALMVAARVAQLSPAARELVNLLGVAGQLEPAALSLAMGATEVSFAAAATAAMAAGLITRTPAGPYQFQHELTRNVVYTELSAPRAGLLHGMIADAVRATDPAVMQSRPYAVAAHLVAAVQLGGWPERSAEAMDAARRAAQHALSRLAYQEAVTWYQRLLELAEHIPATPGEHHAELLIECGRAMWLAGHPDAQATLVRAASLARAQHRPDLIVTAALVADRGFFSMTGGADKERIALLTEARRLVPAADLGKCAMLTALLAAELTWAADGDQRFALSDEAVTLARRSADPHTVVRVLGLRNLTISAADTIDARRRDSQEMRETAAGLGDELALFHATFQQTGPALEIGDVTAVAGLLDQAGRLARRLAQPHLIWLVGFSRAGLSVMLGDLNDAEEQAQAALTTGIRAGRRLEARAFYAEQLAEIRRLQGRLDELGDDLRRAIQAPQLDPVHATVRYLVESDQVAAAAGMDRIVAAYGPVPRRDLAERAALDNLALVACRLNRRDLVGLLYGALEPHAETFGHSAVGHHCGHYYLAHLAAASGQVSKAMEHFEAAAVIHERCQVPLLLAESLLDWADVIDRDQMAGFRPEELRCRSADALAGREARLLENRAKLVMK